MHPCTGTEALYRPTAHRGSRGIALLFLDLGTRRGEGSASRPGRSLPRERRGTHCTGGGVGPTAGLGRCGKSRPPTGIRSPDRPARSQSLYRLHYPAHDEISSISKFLLPTARSHRRNTTLLNKSPFEKDLHWIQREGSQIFCLLHGQSPWRFQISKFVSPSYGYVRKKASSELISIWQHNISVGPYIDLPLCFQH